MRYLCYGVEKCPSTGRCHLQGFVQLKKELRRNSASALFAPWKPHIEVSRGSLEQNRRYCSKDGEFHEFGKLVTQGSHSGKRKERAEQLASVTSRDHQSIRRELALEITREFRSNFQVPALERHWQVELTSRLKEDADFRTIYWVYGGAGNEGKSTYAKMLLQKGWFLTKGGKTHDIIYQYSEDPRRHVVFDLPRCQGEFINYGVIEMIKDRVIVSSKYEPLTFACTDPVHVVVFSNYHPKPDKFSDDRIILIDCNVYD